MIVCDVQNTLENHLCRAVVESRMTRSYNQLFSHSNSCSGIEMYVQGRDKNNKQQAAFLAELMTKVEQQKASLGHVPDAQAQVY